MEAASRVLRQPRFSGRVNEGFSRRGVDCRDAPPEEDEQIEFRLVKLSEIVKMIEKGAILDGKTLTSVLLFARLLGRKAKNRSYLRRGFLLPDSPGVD